MPPGKTAEVRIGRSKVSYGGVDLGFTEGEITMTYTPEFRDFRPDQSTLKLKKFLLNEDVTISIPLAQSLARSLARGKAFAAGSLKATKAVGGGDSTLDGAEAAGSLTIDVQPGAGTNYSVGEKVLIGSGLTAELHEIESISTDELTLTEPLQFAHADLETAPEVDEAKTRIAVGNTSEEVPSAELLIEPIDGSDPIKFYKAIVSDELEATLQKSEETVIEVPFEGIADESRAQGDQLMSIGDQSVV